MAPDLAYLGSARMSNRLSGKVVVVTGAAQGIGFGCADLVALEGAAVVLGDLQREKGELATAQDKSRRRKGAFLLRRREE
jgi:NAD(P)-dependent dehydrogenase (short-subunit alcohol dehydrogenase family)